MPSKQLLVLLSIICKFWTFLAQQRGSCDQDILCVRKGSILIMGGDKKKKKTNYYLCSFIGDLSFCIRELNVPIPNFCPSSLLPSLSHPSLYFFLLSPFFLSFIPSLPPSISPFFPLSNIFYKTLDEMSSQLNKYWRKWYYQSYWL